MTEKEALDVTIEQELYEFLTRHFEQKTVEERFKSKYSLFYALAIYMDSTTQNWSKVNNDNNTEAI